MSRNKTAVFIDGSNFYVTIKQLGIRVDYKRLLSYLHENYDVLRVYYFTALRTGPDNHMSIMPLIDWLDYHGVAVITKSTKEQINAQGVRVIKGNMDIEMAVTMLEIAPHIDTAILFSGDGDFVSVVECMQRRGVHVKVASTIAINPPMCADDLRRQADAFIDIAELATEIGGAAG